MKYASSNDESVAKARQEVANFLCDPQKMGGQGRKLALVFRNLKAPLPEDALVRAYFMTCAAYDIVETESNRAAKQHLEFLAETYSLPLAEKVKAAREGGIMRTPYQKPNTRER